MEAVHPRASAGTSTRLAAGGLAAMFCLPYLMPTGVDPIPSFEAEWLAVALGGAALSAIAAGPRWAVPTVVMLPLGLAALILIQLAAGRVALATHAWLGVLYLLWAGALTCAGAWVRTHGQRDRIVEVLAWALLAGALANAAIAGLQAAGIPDGPFVLALSGTRAGGNLGQPNHLALHLVLGAAAAAYLTALGRIAPTASAAAALALGLGLHWAASRTAWPMLAALVAGSFAARPALGAAGARRWRRQCIAVALVWAAADLGRVLLPGASDALPSAVRITGDPGSLVERLRIWDGALRMILEAPLTGVGYGRFAEAYLAQVPGLAPPVPSTMTAHAHSLPLHVAAELGFAGFGALLAFAGLWLRRVRLGRAVPGIALALAVVGALAVHALVEYPLWFAYFLGPCAFALGLAEGPRLEFRIVRAGRMALGGAGLAAALLLVTAGLDYRLIRGFVDGEVARLDTADADQRLEALSDLRFQSLLGGYAAVGLQRGLSLTPAYLPDKLALSAEAVRLFPLPDVAFRHAVLLAIGGDTSGAATWWRRAVAAYPAHAAAWGAIGRALDPAGPWAERLAAQQKGDDS